MPIVILQHDDNNRSGRLGLTLRDHGFKADVLRMDRGDALPPDLDGVHGVISLGGAANADEKHAWIPRELEFLRAAHEADLPVVGVCLGAQMIAKALGGEVGPADKPEVGWSTVHLAPSAHTDTILAGVAWSSPQFQKHKQEVKGLPPGAVALASSDACAIQAFRAGLRTYAFQYHFEVDRDGIDRLMADAKTTLHQTGVTTEEFAAQTARHYEMFARLADRLCINIATYLIPRVATAMRA